MIGEDVDEHTPLVTQPSLAVPLFSNLPTSASTGVSTLPSFPEFTISHRVGVDFDSSQLSPFLFPGIDQWAVNWLTEVKSFTGSSSDQDIIRKPGQSYEDE